MRLTGTPVPRPVFMREKTHASVENALEVLLTH
jgi:hypothetical protein